MDFRKILSLLGFVAAWPGFEIICDTGTQRMVEVIYEYQ
jgi:hypothetical protein